MSYIRMVSVMLEDLVQIIGQAVFEIVGYFIGRIVIAVVSLGRWRCEPFLTVVPRREKRWFGLFHYRSDGAYFTSEGTAVVGIVFCLIVIFGSIAIWYGW